MRETAIERSANRAELVRQNRQTWGALGFKTTTLFAHEDDLAEMFLTGSILRFERLEKMLKDADKRGIISTRNRAAIPDGAMLEGVKSAAAECKSADKAARAKTLLTGVNAYLRKYNAALVALQDDHYNEMAQAQAVVYSNLASLTAKLAREVVREP